MKKKRCLFEYCALAVHSTHVAALYKTDLRVQTLIENMVDIHVLPLWRIKRFRFTALLAEESEGKKQNKTKQNKTTMLAFHLDGVVFTELL